MLRRFTPALAVCASLGLAGCFVYVPADLQSVPAGETVRLRVTRDAAAELAEITPDGGPVVRGTLVRREGGSLFVRVPVAARQQGLSTRPIVQEVAIEQADVLELELRQRSGGRTALFVGGTAAVVAVVVGVILTGERDRVIRRDDEPTEIRLPSDR